MKTVAISALQFGLLAWCGWLSAPSVRAGDFWQYFLPRDELEAICVTEVTPAGRLRRPPLPAAPVYYVAVSAGYRDFGGVKRGDRPVSRQLVNTTMLRVLAKLGYLPVPENQRPDLALVWTWGTFSVERAGDGSNAQVNRQQMLRFIGGDQLGLTSGVGDAFPEQVHTPGLIYDSAEARNLSDAARHDLYVAVIGAYDVKLGDRNQGVLLWTTRISCPARGYWLTEALPAMMAMAGPNIGRETSRPLWIRATDRFKPEVQVGDAKVLEYLDSNLQSVVETGPSR